MAEADYAAVLYNTAVTQGDTFTEDLTFESAGTAINLTGYTFASQLRRTYPGAVVAEFGMTVSGSTVTRTLAPAVTSGLSDTYVQDVQWTDPSGRVRTLLSGNFTVGPKVTR